MDIEKLAAPFPDEAIHWRAQNVTRNGDKALALAYIDARDVMDRLDAVCGPENWQTYYDETPTGRVICKLSIRIDGEWICKSDGAGSTAVEGEKGGISDALKRAAVSWGIGRYLYGLGNVWAACEVHKDGNGNPVERNGKKQWKAWLPSAQAQFKQALAELTRAVLPPPTITEEQRLELMPMFDTGPIAVADFIKVAKIKDLKDLRADKFEGAKKWIKEEIEKRKENN